MAYPLHNKPRRKVEQKFISGDDLGPSEENRKRLAALAEKVNRESREVNGRSSYNLDEDIENESGESTTHGDNSSDN
jgi:hypothetical protein